MAVQIKAIAGRDKAGRAPDPRRGHAARPRGRRAMPQEVRAGAGRAPAVDGGGAIGDPERTVWQRPFDMRAPGDRVPATGGSVATMAGGTGVVAVSGLAPVILR